MCVPAPLPRSSSFRKEVALRVIHSSCCCQSVWRALVLFVLSLCELQSSSDMVPLQRRASCANLYLTDSTKYGSGLGWMENLILRLWVISPCNYKNTHSRVHIPLYSVHSFGQMIVRLRKQQLELLSLPSRKPFFFFFQYKRFQI